MTPIEMAQALRIRRLRETRAEEVLKQARSLEAQAREGLAQAQGALITFDQQLETQMQVFMERAAGGINPGAIESMRGFHADQLLERDRFLTVIEQAHTVLASAETASAAARMNWQRKAQAAENLQDLEKRSSREVARENALRAEMDMDETFGARAGHRAGAE